MLTVRGVTGGYGKTMILRDIDVAVGAGEIVAIIGRNGVGKSTLMKAIIGLLPLATGSITFRGQDVSRLAANRRARLGVGYVPQGRGIFPGLTVEENLTMGELINSQSGHARSSDLTLAYRYFPRLGERRKQKAGTLSGGEQSMLAIGRVLVGQPDLLLLDEPSEGLQPNIVQQIGTDLNRINQDLGTTVLFVEQNFELIRHMAQRAYVMDKGTMITQLDQAQLADQATVIDYLAI